MSEVLIRSDRIKRIDIKDGDKVLGTMVFNPFDMGVYKKYTDLRMSLAKDKREYDKIREEFDAFSKDISEDTLLDTGEYEKLDALYRHETRLGEGIDRMFDSVKSGVDSIFGDGIYDLMTQGYQDEGMLDPLFEVTKPFFDEAAKERRAKVEDAKLNREQRRAKQG